MSRSSDGAACVWPRQRIDGAEDGPRWHLAMTYLDYAENADNRKSAERRRLLNANEVEIYCPIAKVMKRVARKHLSHKQRNSGLKLYRPVLRPLFPGYAFLRFDQRHARWHELFELTGLRGLACADDLPAAVSTGFVESIRAKEIDGTIPGSIETQELFALGEEVRISSGPFTGFNAIVERVPNIPIEELDESELIGLLVALFGRQTRVELPAAFLEKL